MTEEQRAELTRLVAELRKVAQPVGPIHSWWDLIFDVEAVLKGRRSILTQTPEKWIADCRTYLGIKE